MLEAGAGLTRERSSVESPGIDAAAFPASPPPPWRGKLLVLGRVEPRKAVADAIAALPDGMHLRVVGPEDPAHLAERLVALAERVAAS